MTAAAARDLGQRRLIGRVDEHDVLVEERHHGLELLEQARPQLRHRVLDPRRLDQAAVAGAGRRLEERAERDDDAAGVVGIAELDRERVVVEVDGSHHQDDTRQRDYDERRTQVIKASEYIVLRYTNYEVLKNMDWVMDDIVEKLEGRRRLKFKASPEHIQRDVPIEGEKPASRSPPTRSGVASLAVSTAPQRGR